MSDGSLDAPGGSDPERPRLSILIPCLNAATTIERSLASVLSERGIPFECIVIDDGSTDETAALVQAVADRDERVVLVRLPTNIGVSSARNQGLDVARGEWLAFHDADDRMRPGWLPALMGPTADPEVRAVIGQRVWTDGEREWLGPRYDNPDVRTAGRKSIAANLGLLYYASATGKVFHRSLLDGLRFEGRVMGDQAWTIRALLRAGDGIEVIDDTVFEWWRPTPGDSIETITTIARGSAAGATRMATMARTVFSAVSDEVDLRLADEATRDRVKLAYFDRLLRTDLAAPLRDAMDHRDPGLAGLFDALTSFLEAVPRVVLASSASLPPTLLQPPAKRLSMLDATARRSYWRMTRYALRADSRMARRAAWRRSVEPAFVFARFGPPLGPAAATAVLSAVDVARLLRRSPRSEG
jgi:glycosyltransferase involved in cell wall biosynthesis